ncbi:hypothetical protein M9458_047752, partial [Cirrhinus mrigala]
SGDKNISQSEVLLSAPIQHEEEIPLNFKVCHQISPASEREETALHLSFAHR